MERDRQIASAASSGYGHDCCEAVVDPYTWAALMAGVTLATYFLRQAVIANVERRRKRDVKSPELHHFESRLMTEIDKEFVVTNTTSLLEFSEERMQNETIFWNPTRYMGIGESKSAQFNQIYSENNCKKKVWRCLSAVIEQGLYLITEPEGIAGYVKRRLFSIVFHGKTTIWETLMKRPEARSLIKCIREHDACVVENILTREQ